MAGFEYIVRPAVFPDIRPRPSRSVPAQDDPNKGKAVITGSSGTVLSLSTSYSVSSGETRQTEDKRRVDTMRVYQKDDSDNVNKDNFVDINVVNKLWMRDGDVTSLHYFKRAEETDNVELKEKNKIIKNTD